MFDENIDRETKSHQQPLKRLTKLFMATLETIKTLKMTFIVLHVSSTETVSSTNDAP